MSCLDGNYISRHVWRLRVRKTWVDLQNSSSKLEGKERTSVDNDCEIRRMGGRGYANDRTSHVQKSR